jgi:hypothetical protein
MSVLLVDGDNGMEKKVHRQEKNSTVTIKKIEKVGLGLKRKWEHIPVKEIGLNNIWKNYSLDKASMIFVKVMIV